jgi:hypothetical protein
MATREEQLQARVKELEGKLADATHSLGHAVKNLGGELRFPHHEPSSHPTVVTESTDKDEKVVTTKS